MTLYILEAVNLLAVPSSKPTFIPEKKFFTPWA